MRYLNVRLTPWEPNQLGVAYETDDGIQHMSRIDEDSSRLSEILNLLSDADKKKLGEWTLKKYFRDYPLGKGRR